MSETRDLVYRTNGEVRVLEELREWATFARQAGIVPRELNAYQIMTVIQAGREVGIPPLQALRMISMIGGRVVMSVQLQLSLARTKGVRVAKLVDGENYCEVTLTREDETVTTKYTLEDARRAGLIRPNSNWEKYPRQMLRWRAIGDALRIIAPDAVAGFLSPEEAESIPPIDAETVEVVEPEPDPQPRRRARQQSEAQANGDAEKQQLIDSVGALWRELYPAEDEETRRAFRLILEERYAAQRLSQLTTDQLRELKAQLEAEREGETLT